MQNYISLDLETTGLSPENSDIIEVGAWKVIDGVVRERFCTLVRPIMYIPRTIQEMTGITMEDVADCETIEPTLLEFFDFCEDLPFLGHNLPFDYGFLCYKGKFVGLDFSLKGTRTGIDTLELSKHYLKLPNNKLETVAAHMGVQLDSTKGGFHRAGYDAYVTKLIYDRFAMTYQSVFEITTPASLSRDSGKYGKVVNNDTLSFD